MPSTGPKHVAIVMDGNGRWASQRDLPRSEGHQAGFNAARTIVRHAAKREIEALTLYAFSTENWRRPDDEVGHIMDLFYRALTQEIKELHANQVQLHVIGDTSVLSDEIQQAIKADIELTRNNTGLKLAIAINYGGQWDITNAAKQIAIAAKAGTLDPESITAEDFGRYLTTRDLPPLDLFIRPSREFRISNFLNWEVAYSELYFPDCLWPDFDETELDKAIDFFQSRERRFGLTSEQLADKEDNPHHA